MVKDAQIKDQNNNRIITKSFRPKVQKRSVLIVGAFALIIIVIIIVIISNYPRNNSLYPATAQKLTATQLPKAVSSLVSQRKYSEAQKTISSSVDPSSEMSMLLSAEVYFNAGNFSKALTVYQAIDKQSGLNESLLINAAQTAHYAGSNTIAVMYYKRAIALLQGQSNDPQTTQEINNINTDIQELP